MKKIVLICAILLVAGLAIGGFGGFHKLVEMIDWIKSPGERTVAVQAFDSFDSVEVTGNANVYMVTEEYYKNQTWLGEMELLDSTEMDKTDVFHVIVIKAKDIPKPKLGVDQNLLKIETKEKDESEGDRSPKILICCPLEEMHSLRIIVDEGSIMLGGIAYQEAVLKTNTGYVRTNKVRGIKQMMGSDAGDVSLSGTFTGAVEAYSNTGEVSFETGAGLKTAGDMDLATETGTITISEQDQEVAKIDSTPAKYTHRGTGTILTITSGTGDIKLSFGSP